MLKLLGAEYVSAQNFLPAKCLFWRENVKYMQKMKKSPFFRQFFN